MLDDGVFFPTWYSGLSPINPDSCWEVSFVVWSAPYTSCDYILSAQTRYLLRMDEYLSLHHNLIWWYEIIILRLVQINNVFLFNNFNKIRWENIFIKTKLILVADMYLPAVYNVLVEDFIPFSLKFKAVKTVYDNSKDIKTKRKRWFLCIQHIQQAVIRRASQFIYIFIL